MLGGDPQADAFVTAQAPQANFGARPRLRTDGYPFETRSYIRFDVSTVTGSAVAVFTLPALSVPVTVYVFAPSDSTAFAVIDALR